MKTSKPFYKSRTLWGILIATCCLVASGLADAGVFDLAGDLRSHLIGLSLIGLGLAGYGRARASKRIGRGKP
jgi:hypothetical protein